MKKRIEEYNKLFWNIVTKYDTSDANILRKITHSFAVANTCFSIACTLKFDAEQRNFAYLLGLFHDIGRFEQWKTFGTYNDMASIDHGDLSAKIIGDIDAEKMFVTEDKKQVLMEAIRYHTKPYMESDKQVILFCEIVKNADAYANVINNATGEKYINEKENGVTQEVLDDFKQMKLLVKYSPKTKLDRVLMLSASVYYVKFDFLREEIKRYNYIDVITEIFSLCLNNQDKQLYLSIMAELKKNY